MLIGGVAAAIAAFVSARQKRWKSVIEHPRIKPD